MKKDNIVKLILSISICVNVIFLGIMCYKTTLSGLTGTYVCEVSNNPGDNLYFVADENGDYLLYRQFEEISRGKCFKQDEKIYSIESEDYIKQYIVYNGHDTVYCFISSDGQVYERISNVPLYINQEGLPKVK